MKKKFTITFFFVLCLNIFAQNNVFQKTYKPMNQYTAFGSYILQTDSLGNIEDARSVKIGQNNNHFFEIFETRIIQI